MPEIGIYARVSTTDQDPQRQLDELLGEVYDYIVIDYPANPGKLNDNAMYATGKSTR